MSRADRRINVLVPSSRRRQYEELANTLGVPLATVAEMLCSVGYDHLLDAQEKTTRRRQPRG